MGQNVSNQLSRSRSWWTPALALQIALLAIVLGMHYRYVIGTMATVWRTNGDWSHGYIIPLFSLYYLYMRRDRMPAAIPDRGHTSRVAGAVIILGAFAVYSFSTFINPIDYLKSLSLVATIMGVVLMTCGWPMARWSWFAVAFLLFAVPLPQPVYVQMTMPLRFIAADVSSALLNFIPDMEAQPRGALVEYMYQAKPGTLDIEQACSGIRLMMTMMALGVAMAFVSERPVWQRLTMILCCVPIAIFCNIVRVTTTGFFVVFGRDDLARGFWHTMLGMSMLFIAFGLYGAISYVLNNLVVEADTQDDEPIQLVQGMTQ
ncbi:MAG: exosortase/archaeosortase family protein [Planctomycetes bacterium]|nr:exosortase/archaeosortase family protein [Planctomycetota bacterium]